MGGGVPKVLVEACARPLVEWVLDALAPLEPDPTVIVYGFGKTLEHNLALLRALPRLAGHGYPLLVGTSRKRFLGLLTDRAVDRRGDATTATVALAAHHGAAVVRVHDVAAALDAVKVASAW